MNGPRGFRAASRLPPPPTTFLLLLLAWSLPWGLQEATPQDPPPATTPGPTGDDLPEGAIARLGSRRFQHLGPIQIARYTPDGKRIISMGTDGKARIWDVRTGKEIRSIDVGTWFQPTISISADGRRIAGGGFGLNPFGGGNKIRVWDADTGEKIREISCGGPFVPQGLALSPDGSILVASVYEANKGSVRIFDVESGKEQRRLEGSELGTGSIAISPDGKRLVTGSRIGSLRVAEIETGEEICKFGAQQQGFWGSSATFSPDGRTVATGDFQGTVTLWDAGTGEAVRKLGGQGSMIVSVAFSPDGKVLGTCNVDLSLQLWDPKTGEKLREIRASRGDPQGQLMMWGFTSWMQPLAFSPDGERIASTLGDHALHFWETSTGKELNPPEGHTAHVVSLSFSPDGKMLATAGGDSTVRLWDVASQKERRVLRHHAGTIRAVAFSPDGRSIASGGEDDRVSISAVVSGEEIRHWELDLPDQDETAGGPGQAVGFTWSPKHVQSISFSPDGRRLAVGGSDSSAFLLDRETGVQRLLFRGPGGAGGMGGIVAFGEAKQELMLSLFQMGGVPWGEIASFSGDGETLVFRSGPGEVKVCSGETGDERLVIPVEAGDEARSNPFGASANGVAALALSPDGGILMVGVGDGTVHTLEVATGGEIASWEADDLLVSAVAFSPDGDLVATTGADGAVSVWDWSSGKSLVRREGHEEGVLSLAFSPDGKLLASGGLDTFVILWDVAGLVRTPPDPSKELVPEEMEKLWKAMAAGDAREAHKAIWTLAAFPETTIPFLKERVRPVRRTVSEWVDRWIADLDHDEYARREAAARALGRRGMGIEGALRRAIRGDCSPEVRVRVRRLLEALRPPFKATPSEPLRTLRAIRTLERIRTEEARDVLGMIAKETDSEWERTRARAAMGRLESFRPLPRTY